MMTRIGPRLPWTDPSPKLVKVSKQIGESAANDPIVDLACGEGRHCPVFLGLGCDVIGIDIDQSKIQFAEQMMAQANLASGSSAKACFIVFDLQKKVWPVGPNHAGGVVIVDHYSRHVIEKAAALPRSRGSFYLQTYGGQCGNWLSLPPAGLVYSILEKGGYSFEFYRERRVGPANQSAVSVHTLATRTKSVHSAKPS